MDLTQKLYHIINGLPFLASEIFLMLSFFLIVIVDLILYRKKEVNKTESQKWLWGFSLAIIFFTLYIIVNQGNSPIFEQGNITSFIFDKPALLFKAIILLAAIIVLFHIKILKYDLPIEFYPLLIFQIIGLLILTIATNFLLIYLSIEIVSIASYIFATFNFNKKSAEASIKYALFGGVSSAVMLYGISLLYGITGTLDLLDPSFARNLHQVDPQALAIIVLLTLGGFLFKISAFPFHLWVPDVYEATPTPIVSFLSIAPKAAGILALTRLILVLPNSQQNIIILIALASIAIGNFSALQQINVKRMLAYSAIAQSGFLVGSIASLSNLGLQSAYFYLIGYIFSNMLAFFLIDIFKNNSSEDNYQLENYKGLALSQPVWGIFMVLAMISLIGLPPTVGFSGKLFIFSALWESYQIAHNPLILGLFIFGLLNTALSLFYYLKIPYYSFFKEAKPATNFIFENKQVLFSIILSIPILLYFFKADYLMNWIAETLK